MVEHCSEKAVVEGPIPFLGTSSGCGIVAIIRPCQGRDGGPIPLTRSNKKTTLE